MSDQPFPDPVLITGGRGMLGQEVAVALGEAAVAMDIDELDITDRAAVERMLDELKPAAIINCAAWTNVDGAESHKDEAWALNCSAVSLLAKAARQRDIFLI